MIKLNEEYSINNGQGTIVFTEGNKGTVNAEYEIQGNKGKGKINGTLENEILKGTFHVDAAAGLIEFTFTENGFDAKWKQGIESGPMRGKWDGTLNAALHPKQNKDNVINEEELSEEQKKYLEEGIWWRDFDGEEEDQKKKKTWLSNKSFLLEALKQSGTVLQYAPENFKADKTIVLHALTTDGFTLEFASDNLKKDREVVLAAVTNDGNGLQYASDKLKDDKEIVLAAVANYGRALQYASDKLKDDKEIVLAAVKKDGSTLKYASDKLKDDKEIMLAAVTNDASAMIYASDELNADPEIVFAAISQDSYALYYVRSEEILKELAEYSSVGGTKINFKVRDLVHGVQKLFEKKLSDENGDIKDEFESICNEWFDFNQLIYQNQTMDGDALLSLAQVQFNKYRPSPTDERDVEEYTRDLLNEAIELNDEALGDIISYGLRPEEYLDFSDLAEKACELLWNRGEKNYANALMVLRNDDYELIPGLSNEFVVQIIQEARDSDLGEEEDKEDFENFISEAGLDN
jgi:hypothetical protein